MSKRSGEGVRFVLDLEVSDVPRFTELVQRCVDISRDEPGTLVYDWYLDEATGRGRLYEAYASVDAVKVHGAGAVFTEVGPELIQTCRFTAIQIFGDTEGLGDMSFFGEVSEWGPAVAALG
jgi:quinol monooxygenase YgiN